MGYACPVCETPQRDAEHLANHLAFTAMLHGDDHETWLDERVPGWSDVGEAELAAAVVDHASEAPYEEVFEEAVPEQGHGHGRDAHGSVHDHDRGSPAHPSDVAEPPVNLDADTRETIAEAREMTRAMLGDAAGDDEPADEAGAEAVAETGAEDRIDDCDEKA